MKKLSPYLIPYFISMEGCKYRCVYCNQRLMKGHGQNKRHVRDIVAEYKSYFKDKGKKVELGFFGGTFLSLPLKRMNNLLDEADRLRTAGIIGGVRISTTPDSVTQEYCDMLRGRVETVEIGVQSLDNFILKIIGRNYDSSRAAEATLCLKAGGFKTGHQIMLGLPFESFNSFAATVEKVIVLRPDFVRIYPLIIFKNTPLEIYYRLGIFQPCGLDELIKRGAYALFRFRQAGIDVIRVGLTEFTDRSCVSHDYGLSDYKGVMEGFLWREFIKQILNSLRFTVSPANVLSVDLQCSAADYQSIVGRNKENIKYFKKLGIELRVTRDELQERALSLAGKTYNLSMFDWKLGAHF